jgi:hypothetical protein
MVDLPDLTDLRLHVSATLGEEPEVEVTGG